MATLLSALILILNLSQVFGCEGNKFGPEDLTKYTSNTDSTSDFGLVTLSSDFRINCCGVIKRWKAYGKNTGVVQTTVWRPTGEGQKYKLVGKNTLRFNSAGDIVNIVQARNARISVEDGDVIGFYNPGAATVTFGTGSGSNLRMQMADVDVNSVSDWSTATTASGRIYAYGAIGGDNSKPSFSNLPATVDLDKPEIGSTVYTIKGDDPDTYDIPNLEYVTENTSPFFTLNPTTGEVTLTKSPPVGMHTLRIRVTDHCGAKDVAVLNLNVVAAAVEPEPVSEAEPAPKHLWVAGVVIAIVVFLVIIITIFLLDYYGKMPGRRSATQPSDVEKQEESRKERLRKKAEEINRKKEEDEKAKESEKKAKKEEEEKAKQDEKKAKKETETKKDGGDKKQDGNKQQKDAGDKKTKPEVNDKKKDSGSVKTTEKNNVKS